MPLATATTMLLLRTSFSGMVVLNLVSPLPPPLSQTPTWCAQGTRTQPCFLLCLYVFFYSVLSPSPSPISHPRVYASLPTSALVSLSVVAAGSAELAAYARVCPCTYVSNYLCVRVSMWISSSASRPSVVALFLFPLWRHCACVPLSPMCRRVPPLAVATPQGRAHRCR